MVLVSRMFCTYGRVLLKTEQGEGFNRLQVHRQLPFATTAMLGCAQTHLFCSRGVEALSHQAAMRHPHLMTGSRTVRKKRGVETSTLASASVICRHKWEYSARALVLRNSRERTHTPQGCGKGNPQHVQNSVHSQTSVVSSSPPAAPPKCNCGTPHGWATKRVPDANGSAPPSQLFPDRFRVAGIRHQTYRVASVADTVGNDEQNSEEAGHEDIEQNQGKSRGDCASATKTRRKQRQTERSPTEIREVSELLGRHEALNGRVR